MTEFNRRVFSLVLQPSHKYMLSTGASASDLLKGTGISERDLASPYQLLDAIQARRYYENLVELAAVPHVGLEVGKVANLVNFGTFGLMSLAAETIEESIELGRKNYDLVYMHLTWLSRVGRGSIIHSLVCNEPPGRLRVFLIERALVTMQSHAVVQLGEECMPTYVAVDYPDPGYAGEYRKIFGDVVEFDRPNIEIRYPKKFLDARLKTSNPAVRDSLLSLCSDLRERMGSEHSFIADLRFVINEKPGEFLKIAEAAGKIGMSPRNLRRKLAQEGTNYQQLVDDLRCAIAMDYLENSDLPIQEIARSCGFNSPQNFANAFKRWTGQSPTDYRDRVS